MPTYFQNTVYIFTEWLPYLKKNKNKKKNIFEYFCTFFFFYINRFVEKAINTGTSRGRVLFLPLGVPC